MRQWILGELSSPDRLLETVRRLRALGYARIDTYTPYPIEGIEEALGLRPSRIPWVALMAGVGGALFGYLVQWFTNAVDWPLNVGDRPPHSAPAFIPITFESGVLISALAIVSGLIALWGFPRLSHPVFELESFRSASIDKFWVSVTTDAPEQEAEPILRELQSLEVLQIAIVKEPP